ncbi:MAG: CopD family protein [Rhodobacteraceae bacterium]|nr:CopD family protein [Paracoccaceae bacterium]
MPDIWSLAMIFAKFFLYLGIFTASGAAFCGVVFKVSDVRPTIGTFAVLGLVAAIAGFSLRGAALTGDASGMTDPEMLGLLWSTPVGTALSYRVIGLSILIVGLALGRLGLWIAAFGGLLALWSFATIGHVPDQEMVWLDVLLLLHLAAVALWIGILAPLKRLARDGARPEAALLGHQFGQIAMFFVPLLIIAGLIMSYVLIGSIDALIGTVYGQTLIAKVVLVAGLLGLAALNKLRFVPKLLDGDNQAGHHLDRSISFEWIAVVAILLLTATLTSVLTLPL